MNKHNFSKLVCIYRFILNKNRAGIQSTTTRYPRAYNFYNLLNTFRYLFSNLVIFFFSFAAISS